MAIDFSKLTPVEDTPTQAEDTSTEQSVSQGIDFSKLTPVDSTEDVKPVVDVPKELTKEELLQKEYDQKIMLIDSQASKIKDSKEFDDDTKQTLYDGLELKKTSLAKQKQDDLDKLKPKEEESGLFNSLSRFGMDYAKSISTGSEEVKKENPLDYQTNLFMSGFQRPALGLARAVVTNTDKLGLTEDVTKSVLEYIQENETDINKIMKENKIDINSISGADIGQFISENLPISKLAGLFKMSLGAGVTAGLGEYGKGESGVESTTHAVETGAVALVGGKALEFAVPRVVSAVKGISIEANKLGAKLGMSAEEVANATKGVPREQQALVLAQSQGQDALGVYKQAIRDSDELRIKLSNDIQARTDKVNEAALSGEFEKVKSYSEKAWKVMESEVNKSGIVLNATPLTENLNKTKLFAGVDETAKSKIIGLENRIKDNPELPLGDILTIRKQINNEMDKSKGTPAYDYYDKLKTNLDDLVGDNIPKEYTKLVDDTQSIYKDFKNQESLLDILDKSSSVEVVSGHSKKAIDYNKALKLVKEEKLSGTVVEQTINTLKELDKKFNTDYAMIKSTLPKGSNPNEGALGVWSEIIGTLRKNFWRIGESGDNMYIQNAIEKAIKKGNTPLEYLDNIVKSKDIPKQIKKTMITNVKSIKNLNKAEANRLKMIEANLKYIEAME